MYLWFKIITKIAKLKANANIISLQNIPFMIIVPFIFIMAFFGGWSEGASSLSPQIEANAIGRLKKEYRDREWFVMRSLANGLLLRDLSEDGNQLQFILWDDIARFSSKITPLNHNGFVCRVTGWACRSR
jgi:hypothetical protein